jgi:hypothetical protein
MLVSVAPYLLIAWIAVAIGLFYALPARVALIWGVIGATLLLPNTNVETHFLPGGKLAFTTMGLLAGIALGDPKTLFAFRPRWIDAAMGFFVLVPAISCLANGFTVYDAASATVDALCTWGLPYLFGRLYLNSPGAIWQMAHAIFIAGLIYAPGCVFEMIMSPKLHLLLYGTNAHGDWTQTQRWGGYRPTMFLEHGLMLGTFMCCAALIGVWMWWNRALKPFIFGVPSGLMVLGLVAVAILCKSTGALILFGLGLGTLAATKYLGKSALIYLLAILPLVYIGARSMGAWNGLQAVQAARDYLNVHAADSLQVRLDNENLLVDHAMLRPMFGYSRNGDYLVSDPDGNQVSIPDGLWVNVLSMTGIAGLWLLFIALLLPTAAAVRRFPAGTWTHPAMAAPAVLAVFLITYAIDCLMNAMINPIYLVALGGLSSLAVSPVIRSRRSRESEGVMDVAAMALL